MNWHKHGLIVAPRKDLNWMSHGAGPSYARLIDEHALEIFLSGRDSENRSRIGRILFDLPSMRILETPAVPLFELGELGAFDYNGASYPWLADSPEGARLYYTGWTRGYHVAFINDLGLALRRAGETEFKRTSRAPLMPRTNEDPFGMGSVCVLKDERDWKMWYTCFKKWGDQINPNKHYYHIKYATSTDGLNWIRDDVVAVDYNESDGEYVTGKPCVIKYRNRYLMWFSYRGETYRIGLAVSADGKTWRRMDDKVGITVATQGWDSEMICYGQVFFHGDRLCMIYNGNGYGRSGLGLASLPRAELDAFVDTLVLAT